ncbi:hypothetical protein [Allomesorhizobium alhagi]|uniref:hypothetical protein n=1 Tax=Allomesorhizobium alhagi TaxID=475067 RepID=UPI001112B1B3|nr:hypothetical protein [Mesorhizobium alhagi]
MNFETISLVTMRGPVPLPAEMRDRAADGSGGGQGIDCKKGNLIGGSDPHKDGCALDSLLLCGSMPPVLKQKVALPSRETRDR